MTDPDLSACLDHAWSSFEAGAAPGKSRFSMAQVASLGLDGAPKLRTIVLRKADRATRALAFHTDRRSPKVAEFEAEPRVSILGYDMEAGQQVRADGLASLHFDDEIADAAWAAAQDHSLICYLTPFAPGAELADPAEGDTDAGAMTSDDLERGRAAFARVEIKLTRVEWLDLRASGHRRAAFTWDDEAWRGRWLAP